MPIFQYILMGDVTDAPFFVYLPFIAFAFIFLFMLLLKLYITVSSRGMCKGTCNRTHTGGELENSRSRATGIVAHPSVPLPGTYPVYSYEGNVPFPYPVVNRQNSGNELPEPLPSPLFTSGVPQPMLGHCVTSTSFLPPPPPYSQHDRYPPVEIPNAASRTQLLRTFAKVTNDIPPVE